jgi:hypothetical protein
MKRARGVEGKDRITLTARGRREWLRIMKATAAAAKVRIQDQQAAAGGTR